MEKVIRKPDPSKRRSIQMITFKRIEEFLKKQKEPIFKSDIVKILNVDYNSLNIALGMIPITIQEDGRILLKKRVKKCIDSS